MDDLDRWTRVLPLGAGAFGEVHLAWDTVDGRWVALKRFTGQDELGLLRMVIESRIRVSHPHLVRTLAFRLVDDRAWLVTELARGGSLRGLMTRVGALPWGWVAEAVDQILAALAALHATGVVHRDLKPANLLLRSFGNEPPHLLVGDFGIATWRTVSMTGIGAAIGTPGYLAPEYLDGHQPSPATDLFAVGVLAAELLTGRRLVHYSNASPTMPSTWHDVLPVPPGVPPVLAAVLQRMADPDPARRYPDSIQAREALLTAVPPGVRGDLTTVAVPDLLAAVPPGWTAQGPEQSTTAVPTETASEDSARSLVGLPIDGGPTALVLENEATVGPDNMADTPLATPPLAPADGSAIPRTAPAAFPTASDPSPQPLAGSSAPPAIPQSGPPPQPAASSATSRNDQAPQPPPSTATPPSGQTPQPPTPPAGPRSGGATQPPTPPSGSAAHPPATPPRGSTSPAAAKRKARRRRKAKQAFLLVILIILASGAGTLWWAATHRAIPGNPSASHSLPDAPAQTDWNPQLLEPCSKVEVGQARAAGTERCQRTKGTDPPQHWVEAPPGGFPTKSDEGGPFPGESCTNRGDTKYSPTGDKLTCDGEKWRVKT